MVGANKNNSSPGTFRTGAVNNANSYSGQADFVGVNNQVNSSLPSVASGSN